MVDANARASRAENVETNRLTNAMRRGSVLGPRSSREPNAVANEMRSDIERPHTARPSYRSATSSGRFVDIGAPNTWLNSEQIRTNPALRTNVLRQSVVAFRLSERLERRAPDTT